MYCGHCGASNPDDAKFCGDCGKPLSKPKSRNYRVHPVWIIALVVLGAVLILTVWGMPPLKPWLVPTSTPTMRAMKTTTFTLTITPMPTATFILTIPPMSTATPSASVTPTLLGIGSIWTRPADGMTMVYVPAGTFTMGDTLEQAVAICNQNIMNSDCFPDWFADEQPPHTVSLDSYWIDMTEVSNALYALCVQAGVCQSPSSNSSSTRPSYYGNSQYKDYPVIYVNWNQARIYCDWAGARLPTEAEWEKAARGTDGHFFPWGNSSPNGSLANFCQLSDTCKNSSGYTGDTSPINSYISGASPYGALNMGGNVSEWVNDWYDVYPGGDVNASTGTSGFGKNDRIARGGSWYLNANYLRTTNRYHQPPLVTSNEIGFRCALSTTP